MGVVIAWGNSPVNILGSAVLMACFSGYLSRAGAAHAMQLRRSSQTSSIAHTPLRSMRRPQRVPNGKHRTPNEHCCASVPGGCPHSVDLLDLTAHHVNLADKDRSRHSNVALAASTVWEAVKPGCRTCSVPKSDRHTDFL
jgi:hypothetical protein